MNEQTGSQTQDLVVQLEGCEDSKSQICDLVLQLTGSETAAELTGFLLGTPLRVVLILVAAWLLTRLVRRGSTRFAATVRRRMEGRAARLSASTPKAPSTPPARVELRVETLRLFVRRFLVGTIWVIATLLVLGELGVNLAPLLAGAGVLAIAIGFGAQSLVKDSLAGFAILSEDQLGIGDEVDVGEARGVVEDLTLITTTVRDPDGDLWYVPNGAIARVVNKTQIWSRALVDVRIPYSAHLGRAREVIERVARSIGSDPSWSASVLAEPDEPYVQELAQDAVVVRTVLRVTRESKFALERELRRRLHAAFEEAGIEMALPQRVVWLRTEASAGAPAPSS